MFTPYTYSSFAVVEELGQHLFSHLPVHAHRKSKADHDCSLREMFGVSGLARAFVVTWRKGHGLVTEASRTKKGLHLRRVRKIVGRAARSISRANDRLMRLVWRASQAEGDRRSSLIDAVRYVVNIAQPLLGAISNCRLPSKSVSKIAEKVFKEADAIASGSRHVPEERLLKLILRLLHRAQPIAA